MVVNKKKPNPIDIHVGARVRLRRTMMGMSQEKLGEHLGITFQQIQKYEKGTNRIGASRLQKIAEVLNTPVSYFFEGAPGDDEKADGLREPSADYIVDMLSTGESMQITRAFSRIRNPKIRRRLLDLVRSLADADHDDETTA
ncbi:helix-turn-helix domain-containing protein [Aureimonas jatrophae]|uniref:Transcriptional regulator, contains XRE-family HTH domain n=1 Tax=Aureimonas jatrophae TaxID=1166073 RepID=A0A1H0ILL5_9HYPH|nr:helix-turn-helix domain-containing protein [Aureimonas jatrophae]MBB3952227.1 transcriptional regulator with XRE-family HTH domain [Aureimonas jatrophae]SDO31921.1 Transcriptional regulator, contains XRE-family HTH domain [Aureimonas jatrophae]